MIKNNLIIKTTIYIVGCLFICCSGNNSNTDTDANKKGITRQGIFLDSLRFRHYERGFFPYLIESHTFAYTDSMSEVLDSMPLKELAKINGVDRRFFDDLNYTRKSDTLVVDLIYNPSAGRFHFGDIKVKADTIFIRFAGDAYKKIPPIPDNYSNPYRYYKAVFQIIVKDSLDYKIYFRRDGF
jgi:hypothetical protein